MKERSTTAVAAVGFSNESATVWPGSVEPDAKYQSDDVVPAHGAADHPSGPATDWVTSTPPPTNCRSDATQAPATIVEGVTVSSPRAASDRASVPVLPWSFTTLSEPVARCEVVFTMSSVPSAADPAVPVPPAQYQAEDSTSAAGTAETGRAIAAGATARGNARSMTPTPTSSSTRPITSTICVTGRSSRGLTTAPGRRRATAQRGLE